MDEKRNCMRFSAPLELEYMAASGMPKKEKTTIKNLSRGGLCLPIAKDIPDGADLKLKLDLPGKERPILAEGKVVWKKPSDKRILDAGIRFTKIDNFDRSRILAYAYDRWLRQKRDA